MTAVCPQCGSAKVGSADVVHELSIITCSNCGWPGLYRDLLMVDTSRDALVEVQQALDIAAEVSSAYLKCLAECAGRSIGLSMVDAGIVGAKDTQSLTRLIKAACRGAHKATLDEVEQIQKEYQDARRSNETRPGEAGRLPGDR